MCCLDSRLTSALLCLFALSALLLVVRPCASRQLSFTATRTLCETRTTLYTLKHSTTVVDTSLALALDWQCTTLRKGKAIKRIVRNDKSRIWSLDRRTAVVSHLANKHNDTRLKLCFCWVMKRCVMFSKIYFSDIKLIHAVFTMTSVIKTRGAAILVCVCESLKIITSFEKHHSRSVWSLISQRP